MGSSRRGQKLTGPGRRFQVPFAGLELEAFGNVIVEVEFEFLWRWVWVALTILKELARGR
jgi:hypothetical protein